MFCCRNDSIKRCAATPARAPVACKQADATMRNLECRHARVGKEGGETRTRARCPGQCPIADATDACTLLPTGRHGIAPQGE